MAGHRQIGALDNYFRIYYMMMVFGRGFKNEIYYLQFCCLSLALL